VVEIVPAEVVEIVPAELSEVVVEMVPVRVVDIVPAAVVEIVPVLVVEIVPVLAKALAETVKPRMAAKAVSLKFLMLFLLIPNRQVLGQLFGSLRSFHISRPLLNI
jgi:hypothetical protein